MRVILSFLTSLCPVSASRTHVRSSARCHQECLPSQRSATHTRRSAPRRRSTSWCVVTSITLTQGATLQFRARVPSPDPAHPHKRRPRRNHTQFPYSTAGGLADSPRHHARCVPSRRSHTTSSEVLTHPPRSLSSPAGSPSLFNPLEPSYAANALLDLAVARRSISGVLALAPLVDPSLLLADGASPGSEQQVVATQQLLDLRCEDPAETHRAVTALLCAVPLIRK